MHPNYKGALWIYYGYAQQWFSAEEESIRSKTKQGLQFLFKMIRQIDLRIKSATSAKETSEP